VDHSLGPVLRRVALIRPVSNAKTKSAREFAERLGHDFAEPGILERALTHASYTAGRTKSVRDYERLEFLGDRVLGLVVAELLFRLYPDANEGDLAPRLNALVRKETCAEVAEHLDLGAYLRLGPGEATAGGRKKAAILANACEAVIAALYLDGGLDVARGFIERYWADYLKTVSVTPKDSKSALQEWAQGRSLPPPVYEETERTGPDHAPSFCVRVTVEGFPPAAGEGTSKRAAEQAAAEAFLAARNTTP